MTTAPDGKNRFLTARVSGCSPTDDGGEAWQVTSDGKPITVVTSAASVAAMDEALVIFAGALRRLADK